MMRRILVVAALLCMNPAARADDDYDYDDDAEDEDVSMETFQAPLSYHGEWLEVGAYGPVWRPYGVSSDWRPYYRGRWEWTNDGWLWVSDEPWGWATYHYGRWSWEPAFGWIWVPGYRWAPAWVEWRTSPDSIGWTPLPPATVVVTSRPVIHEHWVFVPCRSFVGVPVHTIAYSPVQVRHTWVTSTVLPARPMPVHRTPFVHDGGPVFRGPPRRFVEERVGHPITVVRPVRVSSPAEIHRHEGGVTVYRPMPVVSRPGMEGRRHEPPLHPTTMVRPSSPIAPHAPERIEGHRPEDRPMGSSPVIHRNEPSGHYEAEERPSFRRAPETPMRTTEPRPAFRPPERTGSRPEGSPAPVRPTHEARPHNSQGGGGHPVNAPRPSPGHDNEGEKHHR